MCIAENIGYGKACNLAANILGPKFDYLAFFNADVEVLPGSLDGCIGALELNPTWAVVGPRQVDRLGRFTHAGILGTQLAPRHRGWRERDKGQYRDVLDDVPTVSGAAYFIRSTVWWEMTKCPIFQSSAPRALGAFLPTKHYWNETYLSHHVIEHGHKVVYLGSVGMIHQWHQASPMGGWGEIHMKEDQTFFRQACEDHGILHD
jgi:GT2 family glycosyltransferase